MAKLAGKYFKVVDVEYKNIGKKNTPLLELKLVEDIRRKNKETGDWETVKKNFFDAKMWGERATEASLEIQKGSVLDMSPQIMDDGEWIKYKADVEEETWEYQGRTYSKIVLKLWDYEIKEFDN